MVIVEMTGSLPSLATIPSDGLGRSRSKSRALQATLLQCPEELRFARLTMLSLFETKITSSSQKPFR